MMKIWKIKKLMTNKKMITKKIKNNSKMIAFLKIEMKTLIKKWKILESKKKLKRKKK